MVQELLEPQGALGPDQEGLLRAAARTAQRSEEQQRRQNADQEVDRQRRDAFAALEVIVEDTLSRARTMLPETTSLHQADTWYVTSFEAGARIAIQAVEPSRGAEPLFIGLVTVAFLDESAKSSVANVLCHYERQPVWELVKFTHNDIAPERPPLGARRGEGGSALGLQALDGLLPELMRLGPPPVSMERVPLTAEAILAEMVAELDAEAP